MSQRSRSVLFTLASVLALSTPFAVHAADEASIKGKIKFEGEAKRIVLPITGDPKCVEFNKKPDGTVKKVGSENLLAKDGLLQNVIIYVKSGLPEGKFAAPDEEVVIDQVGCMYKPHVVTMRTGQQLVFNSSDATLHNVHGLPLKNEPFNDGQAVPGRTKPHVFQQPEIFKVKCDVHSWMSAYVGVFDHPFHVISGKDGAFELKGLPTGELVIAAWHEELGEQEQKIAVAAGESKTIEFVFKQETPGDKP